MGGTERWGREESGLGLERGQVCHSGACRILTPFSSLNHLYKSTWPCASYSLWWLVGLIREQGKKCSLISRRHQHANIPPQDAVKATLVPQHQHMGNSDCQKNWVGKEEEAEMEDQNNLTCPKDLWTRMCDPTSYILTGIPGKQVLALTR